MTREEIIRMAREAGLADNYDYRGSFQKLTFPEREEFLKMLHFAALVAQHEREACAKRCERVADDYISANGRHAAAIAYECAVAIRATGEKP